MIDSRLRVVYIVIILSVTLGVMGPEFTLAQGKGKRSSSRDLRESSYSELRAQYMSLRNTDADLTRVAEWKLLSQQLVRYANAFPRNENSPQALYYAALLLENLFLRFGGTDRAQLCVRLFERVAQEYPGHILADDALLKKGDLYRFELDNRDNARRSYSEVVKAYPNSDMYHVAKSRLANLKRRASRGRNIEEGSEVESRKRKLKPGAPLIVIDPGHGGEDFGAVGLAGILEKDIVLHVAFELEKYLQHKLGAVVHLTRRSDLFVPLQQRTEMANQLNADLFISLHSNASEAGTLSGMETYYLDNTNDKSSQKLAERENRGYAGAQHVDDLQFMLSDLIQNAKLDDSIQLAHLIQDTAMYSLGTEWGTIRSLGVKKAPFYVLVGAHMPCVLVEMLFVNNEHDGTLLANPRFRAHLAQAVGAGIAKYLKANPVPTKRRI